MTDDVRGVIPKPNLEKSAALDETEAAVRLDVKARAKRRRAAALRGQHKRRLSFMPWLYFSQTQPHLAWAQSWQQRVQARLMRNETVQIEAGCFVAPEARLFAEPARPIVLRAGASIGAHAYVHGPVDVGPGVSINPYAWIEGGRAGVVIGEGSRIAAHVKIYAFEHGFEAGLPVAAQAVSSRGVQIGADVWIGAGAGITDGVTLGAHSVVGMGAVVTKDVPEWAIVAGVPARVIGDRRTWPGALP